MACVSSKGQITIPVRIRRELGLQPGVELEFELCPTGAFIRKSRNGKTPIDKIYGSVPMDTSTDELIEQMRGPGLQYRRKK